MRLRSPKKSINKYDTEGDEIFIIEGTPSSRNFQIKFSLVSFNMIVLLLFLKCHLL